MPKVKDGTPNLEERVRQNKGSMAETTRKKMVSRVASKRTDSRTIIGMLERHRSGQ